MCHQGFVFTGSTEQSDQISFKTPKFTDLFLMLGSSPSSTED